MMRQMGGEGGGELDNDLIGGSGLALSDDPDWKPLVKVLLDLPTWSGKLGITSSPNTEMASPSFEVESSSFPLSADLDLLSLSLGSMEVGRLLMYPVTEGTGG